jgi:uncharacterized RDD family membrane protein YckC
VKCPKCGYLGFETSDRCRNCGYDFSLAVTVDTPAELPIRSGEGADGPLADLTLSHTGARATGNTPNPNLDRVIGAASSPPAAASRPSTDPLPLFPTEGAHDAPLIPAPRPARAPLSVRRPTPEAPRRRSRPPPPQLEIVGVDEATFEDTPADRTRLVRIAEGTRPTAVEFPLASPTARLLAAAIDIGLLAIIDAIVVYLTLALVGLERQSIGVLPIAPLAGFLAMLNGGYLIAFVAASGQTLGKMATGIRVMGDDGRRVDVGGAVLRAAGCGVSMLTIGLGYLPAFIAKDGRALQDRIAGTRVVRDQ